MKAKNQAAESGAEQTPGEPATANDGASLEIVPPAELQPVVPPPLDPADEAKNSGASSAEPAEEQEEQGQQHVSAPYGFRADGVTPRSKPGRPPKDLAAQQERDLQRSRLRSVTPGNAKPKQPAPIAITPLAVVNYQALGQTAGAMFFAGGHMLLGEEWAPEDAGEKVAVEGAFAQYFKAIQMNDLPPGVALCFVLGIYGLKRATKPKIKSKLDLAIAWARDRMSWGKRGIRLVTKRGDGPSGLESM